MFCERDASEKQFPKNMVQAAVSISISRNGQQQICLKRYGRRAWSGTMELKGIGGEWQSVDGSMVNAPLALEAVGYNPTDRGNNGDKRSVPVDDKRIPLSVSLDGANRHDIKLLQPTLEHIIIK